MSVRAAGGISTSHPITRSFYGVSLGIVLLACDGKTSVSTPPIDAADVSLTRIDVLTQHNDISRSGQDLSESVLTTSNVSSSTFGKLFTIPVQGLIFAQPLIVSHYEIAHATHDVLIVATAHNMVYAFDANNGTTLWSTSLGPSVSSATARGGFPLTNIQIEVGIISTPVIDRTANLVYVTDTTDVMGVRQNWLHALDLGTGQDAQGSPIAMTATTPGKSGTMVTLDPAQQLQRPALLLFNGVVYVAFGSYGDAEPYHGWVVGYQYSPGSKNFTQTGVFNTSSDGAGAAIWQSGQGLLSDGTSIYAVTANGTSNVQSGGLSYGEAFLKLSSSLKVKDWFIPTNYAELTEDDIDLGAGGPTLLPGTTPPVMVGGGKEGILYVVDTSDMGHLAASGPDKVLQEIHATNAIYGAPVVWTGGGGVRFYLWGAGDVLKEFLVTNGKIATPPAVTAPSSTATITAVPGNNTTGSLSVSSNGNKPGTGIIWASIPLKDSGTSIAPGMLLAFDALTLHELWDSLQVSSRDDYGNYAKFVPPTVANGKVYMATSSEEVFVYGPLN
jgi:outer membrane protein assembly factor BamB